MSAPDDTPAQQATPIDQRDERFQVESGVAGFFRSSLERIRSGDLGAMPVVVGLAVIWTIFQTINPIFLSSTNLINMLFDASTVGVIALGIVCILMLGEIDLSVGSISGCASAIVGVLWVNSGWPVGLAVAAAVASGALVGLVYAQLYNRFGMPSFVATLAGLLAILGAQLYLLGGTGSINLPYESPLVNLGQSLFMPAWLSYGVVAAASVAMFVSGYLKAVRRRAAGLSTESLGRLVLRSLAFFVVLELVVFYLYQERGVPWMFGIFVALVVALDYLLTRTQWGRMVHAVGGNREAARRAGIKVQRVYTSVFMLCASLAALGGVMAAARLASASQQAGTGDVNLNAIAAAVIGGTSLFGGRGSAYSALLGILVIQSISTGLTLLDLSSSLRYMITGAVLAVAVIVDSLARRSRVSHGRA